MANSPHKHNVHPTYRPDIDGLRAVAIFSVVIFHAFPSVLKGGFIGVDVFFVISGFLISTIIFKSLQHNEFSFAEFYAHRIKRIFPALSLVLFACFSLGWLFLVPSDFKQLGKHIASGAGFAQNFVLIREAGYFDTASEHKPLLHLWSLAIEEQFYLLFPALMWGIWRSGVNALTVVLGIALASFCMNIREISHDAVMAFFSPQTRFWELLSGSALAYFQSHRTISSQHSAACTISQLGPQFISNTAYSVAGASLILASALWIPNTETFPGWWAIAPVAGACMLITAGPSAWVNRKLLSNRLMIFVGLISYPLYLWHWPLLAFARLTGSDVPPVGIRLLAIALSVILAWLTFQFLEKPIRFGRQSVRKIAVLLASLLSIGIIGYRTFDHSGFPARFPEHVTNLLQPLDMSNWFHNVRANTCHLQEPNAADRADYCIEKKRPLLMLWGDSHAASLYPGLLNVQQSENFGLAQLTQAGCGPIFDLPLLLYKRNCNTINGSIFEQAKKLQPNILLIHAAWMHKDYPLSPDVLRAKLESTLLRVKIALPSTKIIVIGPVPRWNEDIRQVLYNYWEQDPHHLLPGQFTEFELNKQILAFDSAVAEAATAQNVSYISAYHIMCNDQGCMTRVGPAPSAEFAFEDSGHLTRAGSIFLINALHNQLFGK